MTGLISEKDARENIRSQHGVKVVDAVQAGESAQKLPAGLYGFTYTPFGNETPLFANPSALSYEVHTLDAGQIHAICFATPETAALVASGKETDFIEVFPEIADQANVAISLPVSRMESAKPLLRNRRNCLRVRLHGNG